MNRFWIAVASKDHVLEGVKHGFCQACHGKCHPLKRMSASDWVVYYSPKLQMRSGSACRSFTAIGRVKSGVIYQFEQTDDFKPFRIDVEYSDCVETPIDQLLELLSFTKGNRNWGLIFRRGHFEVSDSDFQVIANALRAQTAIASNLNSNKLA